MQRLLRDPLLHFALLGAALFGAFVLTRGEAARDDLIVVSTAQQAQLAAAFERTWRRAPTGSERENLIEDWVREEVSNREAQALGLADGDPVVRRRLRQKYEVFMQQFAAQSEPDEGELEDWLRAHSDRYREEARYSLRQRFFSNDRREDARGDAERVLADLAADAESIEAQIGDPIALPQAFIDTRATEFTNRFGEAFSAALPALPLQRWAGPVPSAYGYHLVFIESATAATDPPLAAVRDSVLRDWRDDRLQRARESLYEGLRERYRVQVEQAAAD